MKKTSPSATEEWAHAIVHFLCVAFLYWLVLVPPLWISVLGIIIEKLQLDILGHCFLTHFAHRRGIMVGLSYWEYVPKVLGFRNYIKLGKYIDLFIKVTLIGILVIRTLLWVFNLLS